MLPFVPAHRANLTQPAEGHPILRPNHFRRHTGPLSLLVTGCLEIFRPDALCQGAMPHLRQFFLFLPDEFANDFHGRSFLTKAASRFDQEPDLPKTIEVMFIQAVERFPTDHVGTGGLLGHLVPPQEKVVS